MSKIKASDTTIDVRVPSDIAVLREVLLGPVKPFTLEELAAEAADTPDPHGDEVAQQVLARFPVEAPEPAVASKQHAQLVALLQRHGVVHWVAPAGSLIQLYPATWASWSTTCSSWLAQPRRPGNGSRPDW